MVIQQSSSPIVLVEHAFVMTFGRSPRRFGSAKSRHEGFSDDARGVQWNAGLDRERQLLTVGVNLEGMQYDGWPIARLIEREDAEPGLLAIVAAHHQLIDAELWFSRDAWQASSRVAIAEQWMGGAAPIRLGDLDGALWGRILGEAYDCLDGRRQHRGRARQQVTLVHKGSAMKDVSPHLQVKLPLVGIPSNDLEMREALSRARDALQPVRDWMVIKSSD